MAGPTNTEETRLTLPFRIWPHSETVHQQSHVSAPSKAIDALPAEPWHTNAVTAY